MNNSMITSNIALSNAYEHIQNGQVEMALQEYHRALKDTFSEDLKINIKCSIALLEHTLGHANKANQIMTSIKQSIKGKNKGIVVLRVYTNLTLMNILQQRYTKALDYFENIMQIIQGETNLEFKKQLLQFTTFAFFRVKNLEEISELIQNFDINGMKVEEIYSMSLMAFNSQVCKLQCQQRIQKMCYLQFAKNNRYDLAIFSLRCLVHFTKNLVNKEYYEKQLAKLVMMGYFSQVVDFNNFQPFQIIQAIMEQFITYRAKICEQIERSKLKQSQILVSKNQQSNDNEIVIQWKYTLSMIVKQFKKSKQMDNDNKRSMLQILCSMQNQNNPLIIRSMLKNNYFLKYYERTHNSLKQLGKLLRVKVKHILLTSINMIKSYEIEKTVLSNKSMKNSQEQKQKLPVKLDRSRSMLKMKQYFKQQKQNCLPIGISIVSITSSKHNKEKDQGRKRIFTDHASQVNDKRILKMVKVCEYGCFLNKRNFNSEGGQFKFVKITNSFIKWGKDPQKIQTSCQIYPLKDIRSIIYGRVTPNLNESCNKMLNYSKCFSLLFQKRTLDFYCKNYEQLEAWVCGLTSVLKKQHIKVVGYTPGKLRWKKMFAILKQNFIEPLKLSERNKYYFQNAYALKLFAKNGYQLPIKISDKR